MKFNEHIHALLRINHSHFGHYETFQKSLLSFALLFISEVLDFYDTL